MTDLASKISDALIDIAGGAQVFALEPLRKHTTFKIGGPADWLVEPESEEQIARIQSLCQSEHLTLRVIGAGSNILVADEGLDGVVIKLAQRFSAIEDIDETAFYVQAGALNSDVAIHALARRLSGYEFASGIPGAIGGAAYMNAGAYGGQFSDVCTRVRCLDQAGHIVDLAGTDAQWGYRASKMMHEGMIILGAELHLSPSDPAQITRTMEDLRIQRETKQPLELASAGSTFKRPEGHFAGQLIQESGMQGFRIGDAQVSEKHAGFVVNLDRASARDVLQVISAVQAKVAEVSGVSLEPEVRLWSRTETSGQKPED